MKHLNIHHAVTPIALAAILATTGCSGESDTVSTKNTASPAVSTKASRGISEMPQMEVFKSPSCGCCGEWVEHIESAGFTVRVQNMENLNTTKNKYGIAPRYQSCHTGVANGYVFEGHIPASVVKKFLAEKPEGAIGLAVPGMPVGSPGMEMGDRYDSYDVVLLKADGSSSVYTHIAGR